jgi:phage FluMu protein Com
MLWAMIQRASGKHHVKKKCPIGDEVKVMALGGETAMFPTPEKLIENLSA